MNELLLSCIDQPVFENEDLIGFYKPEGISFHNDQDELGFHSVLLKARPQTLLPLHRLDKITSGLILFAKNKKSAKAMGAMFAQHAIEKFYIALSDHKPKKKQGKMTGDMTKSRNGNWKLLHSKNNPAVTRFVSTSLIPNVRFFWLMPKSGKTHQLRVAMKSIGAPIMGDIRYSGTPADRTYLHAYAIKFSWQNAPICITCPPRTGEHFLSDKVIQLAAENMQQQ